MDTTKKKKNGSKTLESKLHNSMNAFIKYYDSKGIIYKTDGSYLEKV